MANVKKQNKPRETVSEETHASGLLNKDFKAVILNMLKQLKKNMNKELKLGKW